MSKKPMFVLVTAFMIVLATGCSNQEPLPNGLLIALAVLGETDEGKPLPQPAELGILEYSGSGWTYRSIKDPDSNVFHKAMVYEPAPGRAGILTLGGTRAVIKLRRAGEDPELLWEKDFGGRFSRMRDAEIADLYGDGVPAVAVATHDQGVVAVVRPDPETGYAVEEIDHEPEIFIHEIEIGDLDGDGVLEIYATPSARNKLDGTPQPGSVTRYIPARGEGRKVVADLGDRHAKEILVEDVDGDGRDELYVVVEAVSGGKTEVRRYDAGTDPQAEVVIAKLDDTLCRFLTAGDVDGDGHKEMVAAANTSGLWLLRPQAHATDSGAHTTGSDGSDAPAGVSRATDPWSVELIDRDSAGFEHASILCDLDEDGIDELYVASDKHKEIRRYVWTGDGFDREVLYTHPEGFSGFTWNIMPFPVELAP